MTTRSRRWMAIALGLVIALGACAWAFDANWLRPALQRRLTEASGRAVRLDDLQVAIDRHLDLQVRLRGVRIDNAPWADTRDPMAAVGEARFAVSLQSLWQRRPVVSKLVLVDGRIDLQRQADGLRNWRLVHPDDRGPGQIVIQSLEARRTRLRLVHRGVDLDVTAVSRPGASAELPTSITFTGRFHGEPFDGEVATGPEITMQGTRRDFPMRGTMRAAGTRLQAEGRAADVLRETSLDGRVQVDGPSLARLRGFLRAPLPASRPFTLTADLEKQRTGHTFARIQARVGRTPLAGELAYDVRDGRSSIEATLRSDTAHWDDLHSLLQSGGDVRQAAPAKDAGPRPLGLARLDRLDARLDIAIARLVAPAVPALGGVRLKAVVTHGRLDVTELAVGLGGGQASGDLTLDGRPTSPTARLRLDWRDVRVQDLVRTADTKRITGWVDGHVALQAEGDTVEALTASVQGSASGRLRHGSIAKRLDAELGLDGARLVGSWFGSGDKPVPVACASLAFDIAGGVARARTIAIDTATTQVAGGGTIDLKQDRLALVLTPRSRHPGLLTLERSIAVGGRLTAPQVRVVDRVRPVAARAPEAATCGPA